MPTAETDPAYVAGGASDAEVEAIRAVLATADANEIANRLAGIATEQAARIAADALKQDAATASTDAERDAAIAGEVTARNTAIAAASLSGTLAARPAANSVPSGTFYFATDDNGGTVYRSDGSAWTKIAASATQSGGAELGYAEITASVVTSGTSAADVAGLSITVTVGTRPIIVETAVCAATNNTANDGCAWHIYEGATKLASCLDSSGTAQKGAPLYARARLTPSAGSHTYKIKANAFTGGTATFAAAAASDVNFSPAWIQATEA